MGKRYTDGFTVIETMMFIAISGVLVVALLVGTGAALSAQRYRDSVQTLKSFVQQQYSEVINVKNDRTDDWFCNESIETGQDAIDGEDRGQSSCVIIGRYIQIKGGNTEAYTVLARDIGITSEPSSDVEALQNQYIYAAPGLYVNTGYLEWSTSIDWVTEGSDSDKPPADIERSIAILIVRSPQSGQIYTFTSNNTPDEVTNGTIKQMIVSGDAVPGQAARTICINPNGILVLNRMSVYIGAFANGPSSVETRSNDIHELMGSSSRC